MPDLDPNEEVVTEETEGTEETPVSEIPYPEGTAPPVHEPLTANAPQFTLTEAVIQSAGDISEDTIAEMRKGTAKEALEILHSAEYLGLADAIKNGLSAGGSGGSDGGATQLPCLYCEIRNTADNISGCEYVDDSFVDGPIPSVMVVKNISNGYISIHPTVHGYDRDGNLYVIVGYALEEEDGTPVSAGLCVVYTLAEEDGVETQNFEGVYSGTFKAFLTSSSSTSIASGQEVVNIPVTLSNGAFDKDDGETLGMFINNDVNSFIWPTNKFVLSYGFIYNTSSSVMENLAVASTMQYDTFDGAQFLFVVRNSTDSATIPNNERVAYFVPAQFQLGVYRPPEESGPSEWD